MKNIEELCIECCDKVNDALASRDPEQIIEVMKNLEVDQYWNRAVYIANGFSYEKSSEDLLKRPQDYIAIVSDDMEEHPGIILCFKDSKFDVL